MNERPPISVRCRLFWIDSKNTRPTIADTVGMNKAPQNIRVADNGSDKAGVLFGFALAFSSVSSLHSEQSMAKKNSKGVLWLSMWIIEYDCI